MATIESASQLVFLHELHRLKAGTKVRFVCCTLDYDITTGLLLVEHAYPTTAPRTPRAHVDVRLVIETTKSELFERGAWINVIGYVEELPRQRGRPGSTAAATNRDPRVQAILLWDAGALTVSDYEATKWTLFVAATKAVGLLVHPFQKALDDAMLHGQQGIETRLANAAGFMRPPAQFNSLSVKGVPGVNQIPHPSDTRPLSTKSIPGMFQLPNSTRLTQEEREQVDEIVKSRGPARKGPARKGPSRYDAGEEGEEGEESEESEGSEEGEEEEGGQEGEATTEIDPRNLPEDQKPPMPPPSDPRAPGHGRGTRYGFRGVRRGRPQARPNRREEARAARGNTNTPTNHRWSFEYLLQQQTNAITREETRPSPHTYRYICPQPGCGVSANDAREISRHYNWSDPPLHPGLEHVPSRTLQGVLYKDWLKDENLEATKYATTDDEFYEELANEVPVFERQNKLEFLATIPDNPNVLQTRLATRPVHLENLQRDKVVMGGALLSQQIKGEEGEVPQMVGSIALVKADTEEEVLELLRNDPYNKAGVWDLSKVKIQPFISGVRTAM
ncbi:hypothetical protein DV735_g4040, partial [Chaetothyriales sp. CBS 134920]